MSLSLVEEYCKRHKTIAIYWTDGENVKSKQKSEIYVITPLSFVAITKSFMGKKPVESFVENWLVLKRIEVKNDEDVVLEFENEAKEAKIEKRERFVKALVTNLHEILYEDEFSRIELPDLVYRFSARSIGSIVYRLKQNSEYKTKYRNLVDFIRKNKRTLDLSAFILSDVAEIIHISNQIDFFDGISVDNRRQCQAIIEKSPISSSFQRLIVSFDISAEDLASILDLNRHIHAISLGCMMSESIKQTISDSSVYSLKCGCFTDFSLEKIRFLDLSGIHNIDLPNLFLCFPNLSILNLSDCGLDVSDAFASCIQHYKSQLTALNLSGNHAIHTLELQSYLGHLQRLEMNNIMWKSEVLSSILSCYFSGSTHTKHVYLRQSSLLPTLQNIKDIQEFVTPEKERIKLIDLSDEHHTALVIFSLKGDNTETGTLLNMSDIECKRPMKLIKPFTTFKEIETEINIADARGYSIYCDKKMVDALKGTCTKQEIRHLYYRLFRLHSHRRSKKTGSFYVHFFPPRISPPSIEFPQLIPPENTLESKPSTLKNQYTQTDADYDKLNISEAFVTQVVIEESKCISFDNDSSLLQTSVTVTPPCEPSTRSRFSRRARTPLIDDTTPDWTFPLAPIPEPDVSSLVLSYLSKLNK